MKDILKHIPFRTAFIYFISAGFYILISDQLLVFFVNDLEILNHIQTYKGIAFVLVTSIVLYLNLHRKVRLLIQEKKRANLALRALELSESNYRNMANYSAFAKFVVLEGKIVYANQACANLFGAASRDELIGKDPLTLFHPTCHKNINERIASLTEIGQSVKPLEEKIIRMDGTVVDVEASSSLFPYQNQKAIHVILRDITDLISARQELEKQLFHLQALREIDQLILNSFDLDSIIKVSLNHALQLLGFDAAVLYLRDEKTGEGIFLQSLGFSVEPDFIMENQLYQHIIQEKEKLFIADLDQSAEVGLNSKLINEEVFVSYCGVPLISKGEVKGVLEIYCRNRVEESEECFDLLEALSDQMAIAIDNLQLYEGLQISLDDLSQAYDATIVGWSRAMDLRDEDTEGHTQRVTLNTLHLARKMGMSEDELMHVRRGALLHDIGKLGIPDRILLKPGKLTAQEWVIMRQHPNFAFHMLEPISYLRPALNIPYCHHEKWDGTGYPRGLKNEEIPLSARIFAIIDVWDALRSNRPYRSKWAEEKVLEHIRTLSGTHFDPKVVDAFFEIYPDLDRED